MIRIANTPKLTELVPRILEVQGHSHIDDDYPHVAKNLALFWGTDLFDQYLETIVMSYPTADRPERQGFPYEVLRELRLVAEAHSAQFPQFGISINVYGNFTRNPNT